ncbi:acyl-CoA dehydrogenase family protein [bacterium]|nr:acyl-CoA dehydrogenase family protein [bacterium]
MATAEEVVFEQKHHQQGFVKRLFRGELDADRIFPYPEPSQDVQDQTASFVTKFRQTLDQHLDPDWNDRHATVPAHTLKALADTGFLGLTIPKEFGGQGMPQYSYCKAIEELAMRCGGTSVMTGAHQSIGLRAIVLFGNTQQKQMLGKLARGEEIAAFALTEPEAGSDAANVQTRAVFDPVKNVWRINGQKRWITNGGFAKVLTVLAKTEVDTPEGKKEKVTAFIVRPEMPGFRVVDPNLEKVGIRGSMQAKLEFNDLEVPAENVLGEVGKGLRVGLSVLDYGRLSFGAGCTSVAKDCVRRSTEHVRRRVQFGQPLGRFGLIQEKLARMAALAYAIDATTYLVVNAFDQGEEDIMLESALLKVFSSDELWTIVNDTIQIHGGMAFFCDQPFERMMRDARLNSIGEGANEVMRLFIAGSALGDIGRELQSLLKKPGKLLGTMGQRLFRKPRLPIQSPLLRAEADWIARKTSRLGRESLFLLNRYRESIIQQQFKLERLATIAIALYTSVAVVSKLDRDLTRMSPEAIDRDLRAGKLYVRLAMRRVQQAIEGLRSEDSLDREMTELSNNLTGL